MMQFLLPVLIQFRATLVSVNLVIDVKSETAAIILSVVIQICILLRRYGVIYSMFNDLRS